MQIKLLVVGRMKSGPERTLVDEYLKRAAPIARQQGFRGIEEIEVQSGGSMDDEAARLLAKVPTGDVRLIRLDEHGPAMGSVDFSKRIGKLRDQGVSTLVFLIGGADGYGAAVRDAAPDTLAFGVQTWPHRFVRVMLAEQLYRAVSIMAKTPYHKA